MTEKKKMNPTKKILLSMLIGLVVGIGLHYIIPDGFFKQSVLIDGVFYLFGQGFVRLLQMLVVPLVFFSIGTGVMQMRDISQFGRVAIRTLVLYLITTALSVAVALFLAKMLKPGIGMNLVEAANSSTPAADAEKAPTLIETIVNIIPKNPIEALANGNMLQVIFWAFITGIIVGRFGEELKPLEDLMEAGNDFMMKVTALVMKAAPIGVFALIARTFTDIGLGIVGPLLTFLASVLGSMVIVILLAYLPLIVLTSKSSPMHFLKKVFPVYTFAFSSASSNATIPLTLSSCDTLGIPREISSFTIPLGATINMNGTAIYQGCAVIFIANAYGIDLTFGNLVTVVLTAVLSSIGTAGVPGSGMIMLSMVLSSVGLPVEGVSLIMSVERIVDMFRTALNVTGDVVSTFISATQEKLLDKERYLSDEKPMMEEVGL
ncbi:dicarboxylate/amino acid:cation symporter [Anaerococcus porci]|uniref:dicarboxylate/amino acid:cation symporter n=1 Tax=Anaerococcus porci TaxID=2652269 RepID=UPI002A762FF8|nr:dicarboxylate/amino acid:cation symporter [Anaerococcus porci]MDY3006277.1 dicarboxylate/amino acid:cation symporter [Anaerococcus porci]